MNQTYNLWIPQELGSLWERDNKGNSHGTEETNKDRNHPFIFFKNIILVRVVVESILGTLGVMQEYCWDIDPLQWTKCCQFTFWHVFGRWEVTGEPRGTGRTCDSKWDAESILEL